MDKHRALKNLSLYVIPAASFLAGLLAGNLSGEYGSSQLLFTWIITVGAIISFSLWLLTAIDSNEEQLKAKLHELQHLAYHDSLTDLPNRQLFIERLSSMTRDKQDYTVLFIDLDRFKQINDTHGHNIGDKILVESANRISACLPQDALLARLGGDEYVVLLKGKLHRKDVVLLVNKIKTSMAHTFNLGGCKLNLGVSAGSTTSNGKIRSVSEILSAADLSMYADKRRDKGKYQNSVRPMYSYSLHAVA